MRNGTRRRLRTMGVTGSAAMVYLFLKDEADCHEDLRIMGAREWVAEETGYTENVVRAAFKRLEKVGLIKIKIPIKKRAAIISFPDRQDNQPINQPINQPNYSKTQHELIEPHQPINQPINQTGVAVRSAVTPGVGTAVPLPVIEADLRQDVRLLSHAKGEGQTTDPETAPVETDPETAETMDFMRALLPPDGTPPDPAEADREGNTLVTMVAQHQPWAIKAAWTIYVDPRSKGYAWAKGQNFRTRDFLRQIPHLVDSDEYPELKRKFLNESRIGPHDPNPTPYTKPLAHLKHGIIPRKRVNGRTEKIGA